MGKSKSNIGVKFIDDVVDRVANNVSNTAKNVERQFAQDLTQSAFAFGGGRGSWDNFGTSLLESMGSAATLYQMDMTKLQPFGETGTERAQRQAEEGVAAAEEADRLAREALAVDSVRSTISGQIGARMRSPGRGMTLLSGGGARPNTLLSMMGG